jgi:tRNA A37 threonylcarbamoyladenosine dehydratase
MRLLITILLVFSATANAQVSRDEAVLLIDEMVKSNMISAEEAEKAKARFKVEVMKERLMEIHPYCDIDIKQCYFSPKNVEKVFDKKYDFVIDACDDFNNKCYLIDYCRKNNIPIIVMGGAGGKVDPLQIRVSDMSFSQNDKLLSRIRKILRQEFAFPRQDEGDFGIIAVWSHERAVYPTATGCTNGWCRWQGRSSPDTGL